jgi:vitamin B12 transporter
MSLPVWARAEEHERPASIQPLQVTVQGSRSLAGAAPRSRHVAGSLISRERLTAPGSTAASVLREAPGVQVTELGGLGAPATASLRGATAAQTPVYVGGVRINDEVGGAANLSDVPLFMIDHVEVYRSHAPISADQLGVGGAIFFEPRRPEGTRLTLGGELGSYQTQGGFAYASVGHRGGGLIAGVKLAAAANDYRFFDDRGTLFVTEDGKRARLTNADARTNSVWAHARERVGSGWLSLLFNHADREQGAPKLALLPSERARVAFRRDLLALRSEMPIAAWQGSLSLSSAMTLAKTTIEDPNAELGLLSPFTETPGARIEHSLLARQRISSRLTLLEQLLYSTEGLQRRTRQGGVDTTELSARRVFARAAVSFEWAWSERLFTDALIAVSCSDTGLGSLSVCRHSAATGRVGINYRHPSYELYGNMGRYQRPPTLSERFGVSFLVRGNPALKSELGNSAELGARVQWLAPFSANDPPEDPTDPQPRRRFLWVDAAVFGRDAEELVTYVRTAQGFLLPTNRERTRTLGAELTLGSEPLGPLQLSSVISWLDPRDTSPFRRTENAVLPLYSALTFAALSTLRWRRAAEWLHELGVTARWSYQSNRFADPAGLTIIPQQQWLDLEAEAHVFQDRLVARARVGNLFDAPRFDLVGFPLPGASAFVSMETTW